MFPMAGTRVRAHGVGVNALIDRPETRDRPADDRWAVETHGLTKRFGDNVAVNDVELLVPRGCAFGYLGPNGAGKTTLIRVLLGLTRADAGTMSLLGHEVPKHRDVALARVGAIVDEPRFHGHLTGRQNLQILAAARESAARDRIGPALERVGMSHRADDRVMKYSMGMRQRLGVAACLLGDPQLLILDEPMNGLDPAGMHEMRDMILSLVAEGRTVVLSSHLLDEVERTCDAVAIVDQGRGHSSGTDRATAGGRVDGAAGRVLRPGSGPRAPRTNHDRRAPRGRAGRVGHHPAAGHPARRHRRGRPRARRGRHFPLPPPTGAGVARIVVLAGHQPPRRFGVTLVADAAAPPGRRRRSPAAGDHRGSWMPTGAMIATRFMELRKRRGLMAAVVGVTVGIPTLFLVIRLILHAAAPKTYGPAGGYEIFTHLVAGVLYVFGFIVAATLGCAAGSADLTDGMFRHLVVTGRSRLALYLARIPAGLAIICSVVAAGFTIVCLVCAFAAPTSINLNGVSVPGGLSRTGLEQWAVAHVNEVMCNFENTGPPPENVHCANGPNAPIASGANGKIISGRVVSQSPVGSPPVGPAMTPAQLKAAAIGVADRNYADYTQLFLTPSNSLMVKAGLWIELEAVIGFIVGLGLASLLGQRTIAVVMMIVLEIILTPIFARARIPHFINLQRAVVGIATANIEPHALPLGLGGARGVDLLSESTTTAVCVIVAWLVGWTVLGAWRMMTRDA